MSANNSDDNIENKLQQQQQQPHENELNSNVNESTASTKVVDIESSKKDLEKNESESMSAVVAAGTSNAPNEAELLRNDSIESTSSINVIDSSDNNSGDEGIGDIMDEPESSVTFIQDSMKPDEIGCSSAADGRPGDEPHDTLSPLMSDNHVYINHYEMMKNSSNNEVLEMNQIYDDEFELSEDDEVDNYEEEDLDDTDDYAEEQHDSVGTLIQSAHSNMKNSDTKDSISSIDSDLSLSYDAPLEQHNTVKQDNYSSQSDDNAKDSGCELIKNKNNSDDDQVQNDDSPIEIPDDDFCEKIIEQVEFYFSNDSLLKDAFLLKHVRRNKEGFVSLKLVSSFKRVRQLCKDWRVVGYAIKRKSKKIELNDIGTKIRRLEPLPLFDETLPSRTVVATCLPFDKLTIEKVSDIFSKCGEIALVRILRPGGPIPSDVRQFVNKHPELQQNECALVEFTESSAARMAQEMDNIIVFELVLPKKKTGKKSTSNMTKLIENFKYNTDSEIERSRGGESIAMNNRFKLKRNNSAHYIKTEPFQNFQYPPRKLSHGNEHFNHYNPYVQHNPYAQPQYYEAPRRLSNCSPIPQTDNTRKYSNCSDGYSSCSDLMSRRQSMCSDISRRLSNCSEALPSPQSRRSSLACTDHCACSNSRRVSQYSNDSYRRLCHSSMDNYSGSRKYSNASTYSADRKYSNVSQTDMNRRVSFETSAFERKISSGSIMYESPIRKYSSGYDPMTRKLSTNSDYFVNGRKISTDSGYDRRMSINSQHESPIESGPILRSRNNSLICTAAENAVTVNRNPMGPVEGQKGFSSRTRKIGQSTITA